MPPRKNSAMHALFVDRVASPIGTLVIVHDPEGRVRALEFQDHEPRLRRLLRLHYGMESAGFTLKEARAPAKVRQSLAAYFAGDLRALDRISVATGGTQFQRTVWAALRRIPPGTTLSYGTLARQLGRPQSVRAVGHANGANPISIIVPCHRVVGADGHLTGYGGGLQRKRWLLTHEGAPLKSDVATPKPRTLIN